MGMKKKIYHYDKPQYIDKEGNLLFLDDVVSYENTHKVNLFLDCYNRKHLYSVANKDVVPVLDTFKYIVESVCGYYGFGHNSPKGFSVENRTIAIYLCINHCYQKVNKESKPTIECLADIFGIKHNTLLNMHKTFSIMVENIGKKPLHLQELVNYVSCHKNKDRILEIV